MTRRNPAAVITGTDSKHALPISPNVLSRQFNPTQPNQAWVADITYIRTRSDWLYLAVVLDLFARKVVGWAMAPDMQAVLVCRALQLATLQRQPAAGLIVHADRGSQYASAAHQALLTKHGLVGSMSRKGNCWDNAVIERFFLNLKMERVWQRDYANHAEATSDITDYIVSFYNSVRLHSKLGNLPPNAFEQQSAINQPIGVCEILDLDSTPGAISVFEIHRSLKFHNVKFAKTIESLYRVWHWVKPSETARTELPARSPHAQSPDTTASNQSQRGV